MPTNHDEHHERPTYRGHRERSFYAVDEAELVEIRARQRTFNGAYIRTGIGSLIYAVVVLKLFDRKFYRIGLLYNILATLLFVLSFYRSRHFNQDFLDTHRPSEDADTISPERVYGRPFVTAGRIVLLVSGVVALVEVALLVLIATI